MVIGYDNLVFTQKKTEVEQLLLLANLGGRPCYNKVVEL